MNLSKVKVLTIALMSLSSMTMTAQTFLPQSQVQRRANEQRPATPTNPLLSNTFNHNQESMRAAVPAPTPAPTASVSSSSSSADLNNPASNIYTDWVNKGVRSAPGYAPANYKVDLRGFHMPTPSRVITSPFGQRWGRLHAGLDIKVYIGDTICAAFDGKVRVVDYDARGYGNFVVIRHPNGLETLYGHMSKHLVKNNQIVKAGQPIGLGGNTGRSTGSHLHFETRICGTPINPALMFDFPHQDVTGDFFTTRTSYGK